MVNIQKILITLQLLFNFIVFIDKKCHKILWHFFFIFTKNNVMKLKVLMPLINKGKNYEVGDEINVTDDKAKVFRSVILFIF